MTEEKEQVISTEENKKTMLDEKQKRKLEKIKQKAQKNPEPEIIHSEDDNRKKPAKKESADYTEDSVGYRIDEKEVVSNGKTKDNQKRNYST